MPKVKKKGGIARSLVALAVGTMAAKLALKGAEKIWTAGFHQDVPRMDERESLARKAAWVALSAALVGVARELAKDLTAPKVRAA
jgi:hypothetical protein